MKRRVRIFIVLVGLLAGLYAMVFYAIPLCTPLPKQLAQPQDPSTVITDEEGRELRRFLVNGEHIISDYAPLESIPSTLIDATIAAEDKRFWLHNGVDFSAIARAVWDASRLGYPTSGASTITQQLVKICSTPRARNVRTKVIEIMSARKVEILHSKEWILENYLNRLPYGNMRNGCRAAAQGYFDKPLKELSIAESAFLAGLPNKPTRFNPYTNFRGAKARQLWILDRMWEDGYITEGDVARARHEKLVIVPRGSSFRAPHAVDLMVALHGDALPAGHVASTLNLDLQAVVERAIDEHLRLISSQRQTSPYLHAAVVVIENESGAVRVLTGSRDYESPHGGQINGAWTPRSPGSALKPFTYLLALEQGMPASTIVPDTPMEFATRTGVYRPVNYDRTFAGPVRLREALGNSLNLPAVRVLRDLGGPEVLCETLERLGLSTLTESPEHYGLGLTIGGAEVRLLELTNAYACLARLGVWKPFRLFPEGSPVLAGQEIPSARRLFRRETCYLIADMLSDPAARARSFGWDSPIQVRGFRAAVKTGTSSDYRDAWAVGFTPDYTVGVWVGNFDNAPLDRFSGAAGAGPIFRTVMEALQEERGGEWFERPDDVIEVEVDPASGRMATEGFRPPRTVVDLAMNEALPPPALPAGYDSRGRTWLPPNYANWFERASSLQRRFVVVREPAGDRDFAILSPLPGMEIFLDPDIVNGGRVLRLVTDVEEGVEWSSATLRIDAAQETALLVPGRHEITAVDTVTGKRKSVIFLVHDA